MPDSATPTPRPHGPFGNVGPIRQPTIRRLAGFLALFAVSLVIGFVCEKLFDRQTLARAHAAQKQWVAQLSAMAPLALVKGYWADLGPAGAGEWIWRAPPPLPQAPQISAEELASIYQAAALADFCERARSRPRLNPECEALQRNGLSASACIVDPAREGCQEYNACLDKAAELFANPPPECAGIPPRSSALRPDLLESSGPLSTPAPSVPDAGSLPRASPDSGRTHALLTPLAALVRTLTRISHGGTWPFVLALGQLAMGVAGFVLFLRWTGAGAEIGHPFLLLIVVPVGIVVSGSVLALALKWLMLGAGFALSWVTGLAAAAAGASGVAGFCWLCASKLAEKGVEAAVTGKA